MESSAFCLRTAQMNGEHILSQWIGNFFDHYKGAYSYRTTVAKQHRTVRCRSRSIDTKARVVCAHCNNGWMSDFDSEAKATMKDMIQYATYISLLPRGIAS